MMCARELGINKIILFYLGIFSSVIKFDPYNIKRYNLNTIKENLYPLKQVEILCKG